MKFHEKLYSLRKGADMTQTALAEKLNVSRQAVSRWEMGTAMPDVENLIAMSDLFGVTLDDLLKNKEDAPEEDSPGPEEKVPGFWDFLPKKWWLLPTAAVGLRVFCFLWELSYWLFPRSSAEAVITENGNPPFLYLRMLFSIPGLTLISTLLLALTVCCFLWALIKWWKARK